MYGGDANMTLGGGGGGCYSVKTLRTAVNLLWKTSSYHTTGVPTHKCHHICIEMPKQF